MDIVLCHRFVACDIHDEAPIICLSVPYLEIAFFSACLCASAVLAAEPLDRIAGIWIAVCVDKEEELSWVFFFDRVTDS